MRKTILIVGVLFAAILLNACRITPKHSDNNAKSTPKATVTDIPIDALATALNGGSFIEPVKTAEPTPTPEPEEEAVEFQSKELMNAIIEEYGFEKNYLTESDLELITAIHCSSRAAVTTLQDLELFPNLTEFSLSQRGATQASTIRDLLKGINKCSSLTKVSFTGCNLDSLERLAVLDNLEELEIIDCTGISDYSALGNMTGLKKLSIRDNYIHHSGGVGFLSNMLGLEQLSIETNDNEFSHALDQLDLSNLSNLKKLSISGYYDPVKVLTALHNSGAYYNITDLRIALANWNEASGKDLLCACVGLRNLYLELYNYSYSKDFNIDGLEKLVNLKKLSIWFAQNAEPKDLNAISKLGNLETLSLSYTPESGFEFLNGLTKLKNLVMEVSTDVCLKELSSLSSLERLVVRGESSIQKKKLDFDGIDQLHALKGLYYSTWDMTPVNQMMLDDYEDVLIYDLFTKSLYDLPELKEVFSFEFLD